MYSDDDSLDKVRRDLYSREGGRRRTRLGGKRSRSDGAIGSSDAPGDWEYEEVEQDEPTEEPDTDEGEKSNKRMSRFFLVSVIIFVLALSFVVYKFFFATDLMSPRNVLVNVDGPTTARAGSEVFFDILIENTNKSDLLDAKLTLTFPENTLSVDGSGEKVEILMRDLGVISAESSTKERFGVSLFGGEGEDVDIDIYLEYGTEHSSGRLSNELVHTVNISSSPVSVLVAPSVSSVQSGNQFEIEVDISSNTNAGVKDVVVRANYPGGFTFVSSNPSPIDGDNVWSLGDINARDRKSITIKGYLEGQDSESKYFAFNVGTAANNFEIGSLYASAREPVRITMPPIAISTSINKNSGQSVSVPAGRDVSIEVNWRNLLNSPLNNLVIEAEIDSDYIDTNSIRPRSGFYQSSRDVVVWNQSTLSSLQSINARAQGTVEMSFKLVDTNRLGGAINPEVPIKIRAYASEPQGVGSAREIENEVSRTILIASRLGISQSLNYSSGPFANSGPLPPEANSRTTYTVTWSVSNAGNSAEGVSVRAALPPYVEFVSSGDDSSVRYSPLTNEVVWNVGSVRENAGLAGSAITASFQIAVEPSRSQIGSAPVLLRQASIEGRDSFAGSRLQSSAAALTTESLRESGAGVVR